MSSSYRNACLALNCQRDPVMQPLRARKATLMAGPRIVV
jgi:hypothetical protein